jgi:hypothetical protein
MIDLKKEQIGAVNSSQTDEEMIRKIYDYAAHLLFEEERTKNEVVEQLMQEGLDREFAIVIVRNLTIAVSKKQGQNNMLYGALWCIGGTVATLAHIGFIFWGAIVFGAIQFFVGVYQYLKN